ncbi:MAG: NUDIX hydrolase [Acidobacteria bacterium]|nr:NUDIX hydrolase [Acidobacteriota bacterium]
MMLSLTAHQQEALDEYDNLVAHYPEAFAIRQRRPIVLDRRTLETFASEHRVVLGVAATTPYVYFVVDLVQGRDVLGEKNFYPYLRIIYRKQLEGGVNTVILGTIAEPSLGQVGDVVLVDQERHATGVVETELPRGFGEPELTGEENALRELREETGFIGEQAHSLGTTLTDSGVTDARVSFYYVPIVARCAPNSETSEAITRIRLASLEVVWQEIISGRTRDSFTVQAIALFEKYRVSGARGMESR